VEEAAPLSEELHRLYRRIGVPPGDRPPPGMAGVGGEGRDTALGGEALRILGGEEAGDDVRERHDGCGRSPPQLLLQLRPVPILRQGHIHLLALAHDHDRRSRQQRRRLPGDYHLRIDPQGDKHHNQMVAPGLIGTQWVRLIGYFEDIALGSLLLFFLIFRPRGLIPEKRLHITGINYDGIINEKKMAGEVLRSFRSKDED